MGVDEPGHQDGLRAVDMLAGLKLSLYVNALSDSHDALATNGDGAVVDQIATRVHGDDVTGGIDRVGRLGMEKDLRRYQAQHNRRVGRTPSSAPDPLVRLLARMEGRRWRRPGSRGAAPNWGATHCF